MRAIRTVGKSRRIRCLLITESGRFSHVCRKLYLIQSKTGQTLTPVPSFFRDVSTNRDIFYFLYFVQWLIPQK